MGFAEKAADELGQLLELCLSDVSQLGSASGDEQYITACLYQLQARLLSTDYSSPVDQWPIVYGLITIKTFM